MSANRNAAIRYEENNQRAEERAERAERKIEKLQEEITELREERTGEDHTSGGTEEGRRSRAEENAVTDAEQQLRGEPMMSHLMDALDAGKDIGHYGRLVFVMVAHHFLSEEGVMAWLMKDPDCREEQAAALLRQVSSSDYNPPRRERILEWQAQQEFPILPNASDPDCGNVYRNLKFPEKVYEHIEEYQEEKAEAAGSQR